MPALWLGHFRSNQFYPSLLGLRKIILAGRRPIHTRAAVGVYTVAMRRVQIHFDESLDRRSAQEARRLGISKAAFVRASVRSALEHVEAPPTTASDPWDSMVGWLDDEPVEDIDEVIYGSSHE